FSSRRRHTRCLSDWSSDVCSSDLKSERDPNSSRFIVDDLKFAHFALTDVSKHHFSFEQKTSRGAFGEAGFDDGQRIAWIDNWSQIGRASCRERGEMSVARGVG